MERIGFYPGSFDPVTFGHLDIIRRSEKLFDKLIVGVGIHHGKTPFLQSDVRIDLLRGQIKALKLASDSIDIRTFDGLTVDAADSFGAQFIVRGLRDSTDFDYEVQMAGTNSQMIGSIDTVFIPASTGLRHIAAKFVRQIAQLDGDITAFVPAEVVSEIKRSLNARQ